MAEKFCYRISLLLNIVFLVLIVKLCKQTNYSSEENDISNCISEKAYGYQTNIQPNVLVFNISQPLEPASIYSKIQCRQSARFVVSTTLCFHTPLNIDAFVSGSIFRDGVWEPTILKPFTEIIAEHPEYLVLDIGAQIGEYSLFAAKIGRDVVTVEPFYENYIRIHKAAKLENIDKRITLITNAISNQRNEIKKLEKNDNNIGGQSLLYYENKKFTKESLDIDKGNINKFLVETILMDDLLNYLPKRRDNKSYEQAILKIDIEGFEPYAFQYSKNLFKQLDIRFIFMEWGKMAKEKHLHFYIRQMMSFFYSINLYPYSSYLDKYTLEKKDWKNWPWDIVWKKHI